MFNMLTQEEFNAICAAIPDMTNQQLLDLYHSDLCKSIWNIGTSLAVRDEMDKRNIKY